MCVTGLLGVPRGTLYYPFVRPDKSCYRKFAHACVSHIVCDRVVRGPEGTPLPVRGTVRASETKIVDLSPKTPTNVLH